MAETIEDLVETLEKVRESYHQAPNLRLKKAREVRLFQTISRLSTLCVEAERWLHENFTTGKDETWLRVLVKYQKGAASLQQGTRRTSHVPSSLPVPPILETKSPPLTDRYVN